MFREFRELARIRNVDLSERQVKGLVCLAQGLDLHMVGGLP